MSDNIKVFYRDMPCSIHAVTAYCIDDGQAYFSVFVNSQLDVESQDKAIDHELIHISDGDFDKMTPIGDLESLRHYS